MNSISRIEIISERQVRPCQIIHGQSSSTAAQFPPLKPRTRLWPDRKTLKYLKGLVYMQDNHLYVFLNSH